MRSFEIFVAPAPRAAAVSAAGSWTPHAATLSSPAKRRARDVLDVFIGGANVTAFTSLAEPGVFEPGEAHARSSVAGALRDLAAAVVDLATRPRGKAIVRFYDEPWELCVERLFNSAALSVYRGGSDPTVAVYDRIVPFVDVVASLREAIADVIARSSASPPLLLELGAAERELAEISLPESEEAVLPRMTPIVVEIDKAASVSLAAEFALREGRDGPAEGSVERTDVHALLFRGKLRAEVRGRGVDLGTGHPFLVAERLVAVARQTLDAWERGAASHVRAESGGVLVGVRLGADGALALTLGASRKGGEREVFTFPALEVPDLVEAAMGFGRGIARAVLRRDRSQAQNLRLSGFRRQIHELSDLLREACRDDAKVNLAPESYRAFLSTSGASAAQHGPRRDGARPVPSPARLRYGVRWRALVPGIDLRATFLCGDRLVIGAALETFCLDRTSGDVLWRVPTERATSVVTPGGIARLHQDGELCVHDFGTGEVTLRSWLAPRTHGPPAGAVVHVPGLPRLLILTEGERHLVAIDLLSGEPRWRFAWGQKGSLRLKRAGKLLYFTSGTSALTALDVLTGAVVWRVRDRLRFRAAPTVDHDALFAVAGGMGARAHLVSVDAFSGHVRWTRAMDSERGTTTVDGAPIAVGHVVACAVRERQGLALMAWDRESGELAWKTAGHVAPVGTSWLAVDDLLVGNTPTGELLAIDANTGATRYRHALGTVLETDVPRRLEPVLRSGALFVPHTNVHVFRPHDGGEIGVIAPCEAIPDLLRVDERCDVYVAEESGHVASFAAGPRLSLVK
jgi:outer membrane protein assembly factor BamB